MYSPRYVTLLYIVYPELLGVQHEIQVSSAQLGLKCHFERYIQPPQSYFHG